MNKIIIAQHYGFCMGVKRAIAITEETMAIDGNVTILNEIVHNEAIVEKFRREGVGQATSVADIKGGTVIISAHGASPEIFRRAEARGLKIIDATCPLVIRIHKIVKKLAENGYHVLHFGDSRHDETIGIVGHAPEKVSVISSLEDLAALPAFEGKLAMTSQTTARVSDFAEMEVAAKVKFPQIEIFNTICNATSQRQAAIMDLAPKVDLMLVVGSESSANSKRLAQISRAICGLAYLINTAEDIKPEWFSNPSRKIDVVGLSAGASTPDFLIEGAIERLKAIAESDVEVVYPHKRDLQNRLALRDDGDC
ncbi:4-hydroxy-3-methylbut-2-enyl diphosphate reductase [Candidatus Zixiibacteriota bacterium]|nr:4-hydroxy-3-methylbut-2-enyl diphosphate reductase [candidate division Zixibacteria bacterium]